MEFPYRWPKIHRFPWGLCHPYKFWGTGVSVKAGTHFRIVSDPPARFAKFSDAKLWGLWRWGKKKRFSWGDTQRWGEEVISRDSFGTYVIYIICMTCIYMISDFCRLSVVDFCWFMGCLRMVLFCFVFGGFEGLWNGFLRHNLNHQLVGNQLVIGWILCATYRQTVVKIGPFDEVDSAAAVLN